MNIKIQSLVRRDEKKNQKVRLYATFRVSQFFEENVKMKGVRTKRLYHYIIPNRICHWGKRFYDRDGETDQKVLIEWVETK